VQLAGTNALPDTVTAVAVNVTAVTPLEPGYLLLYPSGTAKPTIPALNYTAGQVANNGTLVAVGQDGKVCLAPLTTTHVVLDITGYFPVNSAYVPVTPFRFEDTRDKTLPAAGSTHCFAVTGSGGIPERAKAVVGQLVAVNPTEAGFLIVFANGTTRPTTSSLNYSPGHTVSNGVIYPIGTDFKTCLYTSAASHFILDLHGYFSSTSTYIPIAPYRRLDTRGQAQPLAGSTQCFPLADHNGLPATARVVAVNLTAVDPTENGFLSIYSQGQPPPETSSLNYTQGMTRASSALVQIGTEGGVCIHTQSTTHYLLDVVGYFSGL